MALDQRKYERKWTELLRDIRPLYVRFGEWLKKPRHSFVCIYLLASTLFIYPSTIYIADIIFLIYALFIWWLVKRPRKLPFKMPADSKLKDLSNVGPGRSGKPEGILYLGNIKNTNEEIWFTNSDARTHILYLGTTGAGKTEGLKSIVTNALCWGSGFVYIDGKADTDLWSSLSALCRRFGRDDDLMVLNYMTGNSNARAPSNTMNPFSSGSASYLTNMLVSLMPEAEGDNAMWKERAVSLISSLMPALVWKRDKQDVPLSVSTIRDYLNLHRIIQLSRDEALPKDFRESIKGYLNTLPGYVDEAFDDNGKEKPMGPDQPMVDTTTVRQQHGYLTMQFTRALQSLGDDYGYIFDAQAADVDMIDIVLNRRILIVLIPALEKSGDETANLGKIVVATLKGMMGSTLGSTVEGESSTVIENKPTHSSTPFMTIFDEVGYYTVQGMAVMAAQARSLGFSLVFSAQDLPALQKRVKEESRSITGNCNIKIFGKLQDPTDTKDFFERQAGKALIMESSGFALQGGMSTGAYHDSLNASTQARERADYGDLKQLREGAAVMIFENVVIDTQIFYSNPGHAKAMRVTRYLGLPAVDEQLVKHSTQITQMRDRLVSKTWTAANADVAVNTPIEIASLADGLKRVKGRVQNRLDEGIAALAELHARQFPDDAAKSAPPMTDGTGASSAPSMPSSAPVLTATPAQPTAPAAAPPADKSAGPMGFFGKKPETAPPPEAFPAQSAAPDTATLQKPPGAVSWNDLVEKSDTAASATPAAAPPAAIKAQLDDDVQRILKQAGDDMRSSVFKNDTDKKD